MKATITMPEGRVYRLEYDGSKLVRIVNIYRPRHHECETQKTLWVRGEKIGPTAKRIMREIPIAHWK